MGIQAHDRTFSDVAAYGSDSWIAARFGRSLEWFRKSRTKLEADGFPKPDPLIGFTLKADVDAWLAKRRRVADATPRQDHPDRTRGVNLAKL